MQLRALAIAIVALTTGIARADVTYAPAGRHYTVELPKAPDEDTDAADTAAGKLPMYEATVDLPDGGLVMIVTTTYPDAGGMTPLERVQAIFEGMVRSAKGHITQALAPCRDTKLLCRELTFRWGNGSDQDVYTFVRVYLVGFRMFQVEVATSDPRELHSAAARRVLDTFRVIP